MTLQAIINRISWRAKQRFALSTIGPNEARIVFDLSASLGSAVATYIYGRLAVGSGLRVDFRLLLVGLLFPISNGLAGMYSRLRRGRIGIKVAVLSLSIVAVTAAAVALGISPAAAILWAMLTGAPTITARVLLGLPHSKHKSLERLAVNRRGPILVIGGAGYIGSHVIDLLLSGGHRVLVLDNLMYGRDALLEFADNPHFELIEGDITDITKLTSAAKGASAVVHLAGLVGDPACAVDVQFTRHTNIAATRMAKDVAQSLGVYRFIFASSCSVYGAADEEVTETGNLNPVSIYAQTKIDSERELLLSGRDDFIVTILRFATVFGHSRRPRFDLVANLFTAQALEEGLITVTGPSQWRPFVHVRDVARAIVMTLEADSLLVENQVYNVGDRRLNMTILQLAETVKRVVSQFRNVDIVVREDATDKRNYAVSFTKIHSHLGFECSTMIEDGIREMAEHFRAGDYSHYREAIYSNLATTKAVIPEFYDVEQSGKLYGPLR